MTIYDATLSALEADPKIKAAWNDASPGDRSLLLTMLEHGGGDMMTSAGSPNHRLWLRFEDHGWLTVAEDDGVASLPIKRIRASFTELGWRAIPVILGRWGFGDSPQDGSDTSP